jgi:hypothetical protein
MADGRYVLVDFGIAKYAGGAGTVASARALTPGYAPIEQYHGGTDQRSDIYALGATLYSLLTAHAPPSATSMAAGAPLPPLHPGRSGASAKTEKVIHRAMATQVRDRFQSVAEMYKALLGETLPAITDSTSAAGDGGAVSARGRTTRRRDRGSSRRPAIAVLLLALGAFLIVGGWRLLGGAGGGDDGAPADGAVAAAVTDVVPATDTATATWTATAMATAMATATSTMEPKGAAVDRSGSESGLFEDDSLSTPTPPAVDTPVEVAADQAVTAGELIDASAVVSAILAALPTPTPRPPTATPTALPPTSTPLPHRTPTNTPRPTNTPVPTLTPTLPAQRPTVALPQGTVRLQQPAGGEPMDGRNKRLFSWSALPDLPSGVEYELVFWKPGEDGLTAGRSPIGASSRTSALVDLDAADAVLGTVVDPGATTCWGIRLWDTGTNRALRMVSEGCRQFVYAGTGGGSDDGGGDDGGGANPND